MLQFRLTYGLRRGRAIRVVAAPGRVQDPRRIERTLASRRDQPPRIDPAAPTTSTRSFTRRSRAARRRCPTHPACAQPRDGATCAATSPSMRKRAGSDAGAAGQLDRTASRRPMRATKREHRPERGRQPAGSHDRSLAPSQTAAALRQSRLPSSPSTISPSRPATQRPASLRPAARCRCRRRRRIRTAKLVDRSALARRHGRPASVDSDFEQRSSARAGCADGRGRTAPAQALAERRDQRRRRRRQRRELERGAHDRGEAAERTATSLPRS